MTKEDLLKLAQDNKKLLVKFGAEWCGPCKVVDKILPELPKDISVITIDVEEEDDLASEMGIRNIPFILYFVDGAEVGKSVGSVTKEEILKNF